MNIKVKICTMLMCASIQMYATGETAVSNASRDAVVNNANARESNIHNIMMIYLEGKFVDDRSFTTVIIDRAQQESWYIMHRSRVLLGMIGNRDSALSLTGLLPASILNMNSSRVEELISGVDFLIENTLQDLLRVHNSKTRIVTSVPSQGIIRQAEICINILKSCLEQYDTQTLDMMQDKYFRTIIADLTYTMADYMLERRDSHMITENSLETIRSCVLEGVFIDDKHGQSYIIDKTHPDILYLYDLLHDYKTLSTIAISNDVGIEEKNLIIENLPMMKYIIQMIFKKYLLQLGINMKIITELPSAQSIIRHDLFRANYRRLFGPDFTHNMTADTEAYNAEIANGTRVARSLLMMQRYMKYRVAKSPSIFSTNA